MSKSPQVSFAISFHSFRAVASSVRVVGRLRAYRQLSRERARRRRCRRLFTLQEKRAWEAAGRVPLFNSHEQALWRAAGRAYQVEQNYERVERALRMTESDEVRRPYVKACTSLSRLHYTK